MPRMSSHSSPTRPALTPSRPLHTGTIIATMLAAAPGGRIGAACPIPRAFGFATMLRGALLGGGVGYVVGDTRSALCRLQGQTALAQLEGAKHARGMADAMREIHEIHQQIRGLAHATPAVPESPSAPRASSS